MKKDIHPKDYNFVVFKDMSNDYAFLTRSTAKSKEKIIKYMMLDKMISQYDTYFTQIQKNDSIGERFYESICARP